MCSQYTVYIYRAFFLMTVNDGRITLRLTALALPLYTENHPFNKSTPPPPLP